MSQQHGSAKYTWAVPGRWLRIETESTMMGMQIKGFGVSGYDNFKKKSVGSWFDSLSTALLTFEFRKSLAPRFPAGARHLPVDNGDFLSFDQAARRGTRQ